MKMGMGMERGLIEDTADINAGDGFVRDGNVCSDFEGAGRAISLY